MVAIFGTILAAVIKMVLLGRQTGTEEERSSSEKVFEQKIELYNEAVDALEAFFLNVDSNNQIRIRQSEIIKLEFLLAKLIMVADESTVHKFNSICKSISKKYDPSNGMLNVTSNDRHLVLRFVDRCRYDLGLSSKNIDKRILEGMVLENELFAFEGCG